MRIFITGGTGFIGSKLAKSFTDAGHIVTILTRKYDPSKQRPNVSFIEGNPTKPGHWQDHIKDQDVIINLAGFSIFCRWTEENKRKILESRVYTTRNIVEAIGNHTNNQISLFNASAIGYYGFHQYKVFNEDAPPGSDFLATVANKWEAEALMAEKHNARVVLCRFGIVLSPDGGALYKMLPAFKLGLGSPLGTGKQWVSWISIDDLIRIFHLLLENNSLSGPYNCTSPKPITNYELSKMLGKALRRPVILPSIPASIIKLILGEMASMVLNGQKVYPQRLLDNNFRFKHNSLPLAFSDLI